MTSVAEPRPCWVAAGWWTPGEVLAWGRRPDRVWVAEVRMWPRSGGGPVHTGVLYVPRTLRVRHPRPEYDGEPLKLRMGQHVADLVVQRRAPCWAWVEGQWRKGETLIWGREYADPGRWWCHFTCEHPGREHGYFGVLPHDPAVLLPRAEGADPP